jgi:ferrous iron transport protein A
VFLPAESKLQVAPTSDSLTSLADGRRGFAGVIMQVRPAPAAGGLEASELERRLLEIGFVEGARVEILHEGAIGRDPIAVRLDDMRVALRRREANAVMVQADAGEAVYLAAAE